MRGVICAGGVGSRLYPLTRATNKHLLPVYNKPIIFYPIQTLISAGITEILIVVGGPHAGDFINVLRNGEHFGLKEVNYVYQEENRSGIADAILYAKDFADSKPITVILGDNTTDADISEEVNSFKIGATVFFKKVENPERFGVPVFDKNTNKVLRVEEKPSSPLSKYAQTGLYIYDSNVFKYIESLSPSNRNELEVTDLNNIYIKKNKFTFAELKGFWTDAGTFDSLLMANMYWAHKGKQ